MTGTGRERLTGQIEVDEAFYGGLTPGKRGRGSAGKTLVGAAVERRGSRMGRIRMQVLASASAGDLARFLGATVAPGATVVTDGWVSYPPAATAASVTHEPHVVAGSGEQAHVILPGVHRVFSLSKRMLEGTYQDGMQARHLQAYLDEFVFRFNRRTATHRGMLFFRLLEHAVSAAPAPYRDLVAAPGAKERPRPRTGRRAQPATLTGQPLDRPWRHA
ncbi:IS1595 family transposase, partial [Agromyces bauzanensis]|uniref:IS1595 family transposase n=1 Tax=Agromyces bauzanensis TaxID=1308924 RepID=UPI0031E87092